MVNPEDAQKILARHFEQFTIEEFKELHKKYVGEEHDRLVESEDSTNRREMILYQRESVLLRLNAYLAVALTGLVDTKKNK